MYLETCQDVDFQVCYFSRTSRYTAKKNYTCCECGKEIKKGEKYLYHVGKWEDAWGVGNFEVFRMCLKCDVTWDIITKIFDDNGEDAYIVYTMLRQAIQEAIDEGYLEENDPLAQEWFPEE